MGNEKGLMIDVTAVLKGGVPATDRWVRLVDLNFRNWFPQPGSYKGSQNFTVFAALIWLILAIRGQLPPEAQKRLGGLREALRWWLEYFKLNLTGPHLDYEGPSSRMKTSWVIAMSAVAWTYIKQLPLEYRVSSVFRRLRRQALRCGRRFLRRHWALWAACAWPKSAKPQKWYAGPFVAAAGPRSPATRWEANDLDQLLAMAVGLPFQNGRQQWAHMVARHAVEGMGLRRGERRALRRVVQTRSLEARRRHTRAWRMLDKILHGKDGPGRKPMTSMAAFHILRTPTGVASWIERRYNHHSDGLVAAKIDRREPGWLRAEKGLRPRVTWALDDTGRSVTYSTPEIAESLRLPAGEIVDYRVIPEVEP